ncbi:HU family DNA-binding protein [Caballeronia sp. S22]|uniref:HU family DNA-binding protein n=1 Tax=Caballeronia sp. S22 TaxID=3137182 RepID=UPI003530C08A
MATKKAAATKTAAPAKKTVVAKKAVAAKRAAAPKKVAETKTAPAKKAASGATTLKPVKDTFTKASLVTHVAAQAGVEPKQAKAVLAALEDTILGAVNKKGLGEFTLSGLLKINAQKVEAKKRRFGKDPFTGQDRWFDAKPASVRIKVRALKKLKDAAA